MTATYEQQREVVETLNARPDEWLQCLHPHEVAAGHDPAVVNVQSVDGREVGQIKLVAPGTWHASSVAGRNLGVWFSAAMAARRVAFDAEGWR